MKWFRSVAPMALALVVVGVVCSGASCAPEAGTQLLKVLDVVPHQVELGDRVTIVGEGFPAGQVARVTFEGTLHRPGERPVQAAQIVLRGTVTAPGQVELAFTEPEQALFCGAADRATHTTFEGSVQVAFAAARPGAPPVAGVLPQATLDVRPSVRPSDSAGEREGARLLAWIGVTAAPTVSGLQVESVERGSRAQVAGIEAGDVLASFDGVRVSTTADVVPAGGEREASVGVRPAAWATQGGPFRWRGDEVVMHVVSVEGFRRAAPLELLGAVLVVFAALAVVLLFGAQNGLMRLAVLQRVVSRMGERLRALRGTASLGTRLARALAGVARKTLPPAGAPAIADALACGLLAALPFGQYLVAARLDVGLLFVAAAAAASAAAYAAAPSWRGLRAAVEVLWHHVPAGAAVASVVVATGSLRVQEIERAQGGWPWDWLAFRSPAALVALGLLLACAPAELDGGPGSAGTVRAWVEDDTASSPRGPWLDAACRAHALVVAGLASVLFLGGWLLPGLNPAEQDARPALELAGVACLLAKTWGVAVLAAWVRWALPPQRLADRTRATALWQAPLAVATLAATTLWTLWGPAQTAQLLVSGSLLGGVALVVLAIGVRLRHGLVAAGGDGRLSPFL